MHAPSDVRGYHQIKFVSTPKIAILENIEKCLFCPIRRDYTLPFGRRTHIPRRQSKSNSQINRGEKENNFYYYMLCIYIVYYFISQTRVGIESGEIDVLLY